MSEARDMSTKIKKQFESLSSKVMQVERKAEKEIRSVMQKTDKVKRDQLKKLRVLMNDAKTGSSKKFVRQAEKIVLELETKTTKGLEGILHKLNLPSKTEVDALNRKISSLEARLRANARKGRGASSNTASNMGSKKAASSSKASGSKTSSTPKK